MAMAKATTRRNFLRGSGAATFAALASAQASLAPSFNCGAPDSVRAADSDATRDETKTLEHGPLTSGPPSDHVDLSPAKWIWFPSARTLPNTFVLFRRELNLHVAPKSARGWITADSRYLLTVNGRRIQWGPAPCDPRWVEADPIDLRPHLQPGANVLGVEVLFYGYSESTWVTGKPGFLLRLDIEREDGEVEKVLSDESWQSFLDRAHRPGQYQRWYLRALQEEFDARLHPHGWNTPEFVVDDRWLPAMKIDAPSDKPALCSGYEDYLYDQDFFDPSAFALCPRQIALLREIEVPAVRLAEEGRVEWFRDPADWFEFRTPHSFHITREPIATVQGEGRWRLPPTMGAKSAVFTTFELKEEMVGFPYFSIDAPEGTVVELIFQESHDPSNSAWLDTHWFAWTRFICREGVNHFETFDYEPVRWLQLHIRNADRPVTVSAVGVRRRMYPWPNEPRIRCSEPPIQRLFDASINSLNNSAQENSRDPGRERENYGGAGCIQLSAVRYAFGETRLAKRALLTYSEGLSPDGYFLDPWPACDMLGRLGQIQIGTSKYGSSIDEAALFTYNCWLHYLQTGVQEHLQEIYPRLQRFGAWLGRMRGPDGLLRAPDAGLAEVRIWVDYDAFAGYPPRNRQCPLNLFTAAVFQHALAPLARAFGDRDRARAFEIIGKEIESAAVRRFWSAERGLFVDNLPWLEEDKGIRLSDRTLATSILFDQCPAGNVRAALASLVNCPPEMGLSYPMNSIWRYQALAHLGRVDVAIKDFRMRWATLPTVTQNNSLPEVWNPQPDTRDEWCYFQVTPLLVLFLDIAGIRPIAPGFTRCQVRPQLGDLGNLELNAHTVRGPIEFAAKATPEGHQVTLKLPKDCEGELLLPKDIPCDFPVIAPDHPLDLKRYRLKSGTANVFRA